MAHPHQHYSAYGHGERIFDVQFSPVDSGLLATASEDMTVRLWSINRSAGDFKQAGPTFSQHLIPALCSAAMVTKQRSCVLPGQLMDASLHQVSCHLTRQHG
eukprot:1160167-Pelagomonas_calceolata.AAC.6